MSLVTTIVSAASAIIFPSSTLNAPPLGIGSYLTMYVVPSWALTVICDAVLLAKFTPISIEVVALATV